MNIRERIEQAEKLSCSKVAQLSCNAGPREREEVKDEVRTDYMVDRDRIIHSKSFRRLKHKTQVYI